MWTSSGSTKIWDVSDNKEGTQHSNVNEIFHVEQQENGIKKLEYRLQVNVSIKLKLWYTPSVGKYGIHFTIFVVRRYCIHLQEKTIK